MFGIFEGRDEEIATKTPFKGSLPEGTITWNWDDHLHMMDTHPDEHIDANSKKFRIGLNNFHSRPSAPEFAKHVVEEMSETFSLHGDLRKITNIAFTGFGKESDSYPWHKDSMDVFLMQVIGTVGLKVEGLFDEEVDFKPGDYVWIPRGTHHQVFPRRSRVSFSFGVEGDPDPSTYF